MWVNPRTIRPKSILQYYPVTGMPTVRQFVRDTDRVWLVHDSGMWCEGKLDSDLASFILRFNV